MSSCEFDNRLHDIVYCLGCRRGLVFGYGTSAGLTRILCIVWAADVLSGVRLWDKCRFYTDIVL